MPWSDGISRVNHFPSKTLDPTGWATVVSVLRNKAPQDILSVKEVSDCFYSLSNSLPPALAPQPHV